MPNTNHNVFKDKGCQLQAKQEAQRILTSEPKCSIEALPSKIIELMALSYLRGAQDYLNTGYRLAEEDMAKERASARLFDQIRRP